MDTTRKYRLQDRFLLKRVGEELLAFDPANLEVHEMNASMALVAQLCDGETTCEQIVAQLAAKFELPIEDASLEVYRALKILSEKDLIAVA